MSVIIPDSLAEREPRRYYFLPTAPSIRVCAIYHAVTYSVITRTFRVPRFSQKSRPRIRTERTRFIYRSSLVKKLLHNTVIKTEPAVRCFFCQFNFLSGMKKFIGGATKCMRIAMTIIGELRVFFKYIRERVESSR